MATKNTGNNSEFTYEIVEHIGDISLSGSWMREINIVDWNHHGNRVDIRAWNEDHSRCGKGITMTLREAENLYKALQKKF